MIRIHLPSLVLVAVLMAMTQAPDWIAPLEFFDDRKIMPYWGLYIFNIAIDATAAVFIFKGLFIEQPMPKNVEFIGWCFVFSIGVHLVFFFNETVNETHLNEASYQFNRLFYSVTLICVVMIQWSALFWSGHGTNRRANHSILANDVRHFRFILPYLSYGHRGKSGK